MKEKTILLKKIEDIDDKIQGGVRMHKNKKSNQELSPLFLSGIYKLLYFWVKYQVTKK